MLSSVQLANKHEWLESKTSDEKPGMITDFYDEKIHNSNNKNTLSHDNNNKNNNSFTAHKKSTCYYSEMIGKLLVIDNMQFLKNKTHCKNFFQNLSSQTWGLLYLQGSLKAGV